MALKRQLDEDPIPTFHVRATSLELSPGAAFLHFAPSKVMDKLRAMVARARDSDPGLLELASPGSVGGSGKVGDRGGAVNTGDGDRVGEGSGTGSGGAADACSISTGAGGGGSEGLATVPGLQESVHLPDIIHSSYARPIMDCSEEAHLIKSAFDQSDWTEILPMSFEVTHTRIRAPPRPPK